MKLNELNSLSSELLKVELTKCCGSSTWVNQMMRVFPVQDEQDIFLNSLNIWNNCNEQDYLEAFEHHPKIGDISSLKKKFANTSQWASAEQSSVQNANDETIKLLAKKNDEYETKFGFIFIVCATEKSAEEMLHLLNNRIENTRDVELVNAKNEQLKITQLRLKKLLS